MKVIAHKPKSKWHSPTFTIRGIGRETLSLLLAFAAEGVEKAERPEVYADVLRLAKALDSYVNADAVVRLTPLDLPGDKPEGKPLIEVL